MGAGAAGGKGSGVPTTEGVPPPAALDGRGLPVGYAFQPEWEVTPREARELLAAGGTVLLDCRREEESAVARIEGAVLIPMEELAARLDEVEEAAGGRDRPIIVQCHTGKRSLKATALLRGAGFTDVKSMAGGIEVWSVDVDCGVPRYVK